MATRILNTVKEQGQLIGFRIATTHNRYKGIHAITLKEAETFYNGVEKFDNAELVGHKWKGTECSLDKLPVQDIKGNFIERNENFILVYRVLTKENGDTWGYVLMDLEGKVLEIAKDSNQLETVINGGLINAKVGRDKEGVPYLQGIRKETTTKIKRSEEKIETPKIKLTQVQKAPKSGIINGGNSKLDDKLKRMKELVPVLAKAAEVYYVQGNEIMSNYEYDKLYDELEQLEKETGIILANSVTQKVGYEVQSKLEKIKHSSKILSLDKTKDVSDLANSLGGQEGFLSWKLDGITIVVTYENGEIISAVTRGNGVTGEDVTENFKTFANVPLKISYKDRLVLRGEGLISYKTFEEINKKITNEDAKYKNPRNLASGSIRQLDPKVTKSRKARFVGFTVVEGFDTLDNYTEKLEESKKLGFEIVDYLRVTKDNVAKAVEEFEKRVKTNPYATDGLVISIDNIAYGEFLGATNKFPKNAKAFKWEDEIKETELLYIEWSNSRTGAINPVAVFKPVELEGTTVTRASLHNVSIVESLELGVGDTLQAFKANMIIPQIAENLTRSNTSEPPKECPVCNGKTEIRESEQAKVLFCTNPDCAAKHIGSLVHFAVRDAMNIDGLSESTMERLVNEGFIKEYKDIYNIENHKDTIVKLEGFGKRSYEKLYKAIEKSREVELPSFIYALGVGQLGRSTSKLICEAFEYDLERLITATEEDFEGIDGVGPKTIKEVTGYFNNPNNQRIVREVVKELKFKEPPKINRNSPITGKVFCITGEVLKYKNRKELQTHIESLGGKASSGVSSKTNYLINNDITSGSSKNQKAKQLGIPIISEQDFLDML